MTKLTVIRSGLFYRRTLRDALRDMEAEGRAKIVGEARGRWESTFYVKFLPLPEARNAKVSGNLSRLGRFLSDVMFGPRASRRPAPTRAGNTKDVPAALSASTRTGEHDQFSTKRAA